jgi:chromosome segregation ATPase
MEQENLTLVVLKEIREEGKKTNERLGETNSRLDQLRQQTNDRLNEPNTRLDQLRDELSRLIVESGVRTATAITSLAGTVGELVTFLKQERDLRPRLEQCEKDIVNLKSRLPDA